MGDALRLPTFQDREHIGCAVCIALFCQPDRAQRQVGVILPGDPDDDVPVLPADKPPESSLEVGRDLFQIPDSLARSYIFLFFTFLFFTFLISGTFKGVIRTFNWVFLTGNAFKGQLSKNTGWYVFFVARIQQPVFFENTYVRAAVPHNPEEPPLDTRRSQYAEHLIHSLIEQGTPQTPL